jgi:hypothetical protein
MMHGGWIFTAVVALSASGVAWCADVPTDTLPAPPRIASLTSDVTAWDDLPNYRERTVSNGRLGIVVTGVAVYDIAFYQTLKKPWWGGEKSDFHVDNDWWGNYSMEVDKLGHAWGAQMLAVTSASAYEWSGMSRRESLFWGGVTSLATQTQVEVLDGYTAKYGFSLPDYAANIAGAFYPLMQELWSPLRLVTFKMSYHGRRYEADAYRGRAEPNRLEDYSRQTYWLAFDVNGMLPRDTRRWWPDWLGIAAGYGVDNAFAKARSDRIREYYLAVDLDPSRIRTGNRVLSMILAPFHWIHLPSPAIRFRDDGTRVYALHF